MERWLHSRSWSSKNATRSLQVRIGTELLMTSILDVYKSIRARTSIFRVQSDFVIHMGDFDVSWHRAYIVVPHLSRHILLVLQASSKTYALLYTVQNSAANDHSGNILSKLFEESNRNLHAQGWKAGHIGPFRNLLKESTTMNSIENKYIGIFITYCIYFLIVDVPVYFDAMDSKLRENLAYYCIVGHLPF